MKLSRFLAVLMLSWSALAQAADEAPWYDIELILFKQGASGGEVTENWPEDPGSPEWSGAVALRSQAPASDPLQPYSLLPRAERQLNAQFNALRRTRTGIEPLFHQAWRQQVTTGRQAESIYLGPDRTRNSSALPPPFEGLIKISVSRYLHVELDILLRRANNSLPSGTTGALPSPTRGSIRFHANRRMRSGELHYIDHPKMGALIMISRTELPEPEPAPEPLPAETPDTPDMENAPSETTSQAPDAAAPTPAAN